jgi:hypothetical protein
MPTPINDLTQHPPRSPRVRLGGYVILPRILDKGRATIAGKNGEYHFNCPLDRHWFDFTGTDAEALKAELAKGLGDGAILEWIDANAKLKRSPVEILAWSAYHDTRGPSDVEGREYFHDYHVRLAPKREDVTSWFDVLDIDDYVTFGGVA